MLALVVAGGPTLAEAEASASTKAAADANDASRDEPEDIGLHEEIEVKAQAERVKTVTVMDRKDMEGEFAANLNDFLFSGIPGVSTTRRSNLGFSGPGAGFTIRGFSNRHVAVFVDGIPSQVNSHGHPRTDQYAPDLLDRVEVLRGPSAVEHGPSAVGGVISIYTRRPPQGFSGSAQILHGELATTMGSGDIAYGWDGGYALASFTKRESDAAEGLGEHFTLDNVNFNFRQNVGETWTVGLRVNDTEEDPSDQFGTDPDQVFFRFVEDLTTVVGSLDRKTERSATKIAVQVNELDTSSFRESINMGAFNLSERTETEDGVYVKHTWASGDRNTWTVGFDAVEYGDENPRGSQELSEDYVSPYFHFGRGVSDSTTLEGGVRVTDSSQFGSDVSPEIGVIHNFNPELALRARAGRAFRVPRVSEVYAAVPNTELEPDEFLHAEVGVNQRIGQRSVIDAAVWWMDGDNLIQSTGSGASQTNVNTGEFTFSGLELGYGIRINDIFTVNFGGGLLDAAEGRNVPQQTVDAGIDVRPGRWRITATGRWAGDNSNASLDDYTVIDARLAFSPVDNVALLVDVLNLTDETYATTTGFGGPIIQVPQTILAGVRVGWGPR